MPEIDISSYAKFEIRCILCGSARELTEAEAEYNRYFGTVGRIYICDECKNAIEWAKEHMNDSD